MSIIFKLLRLCSIFILLPFYSNYALANENTNQLRISPIIKRVKDEKPKKPQPNPGLSFGIPSAMGSSWKDVFVSVAYTADYDEGLFTWHDKNNKKVADGSMNFGFGFGDPNESIGGEISVGIISLLSQKGESGFGADGTAGIKGKRIH